MSNPKALFTGPAPRNQTLEQLPFRALAFFSGLSKHPEIEAQLVAVGYTPEAHQEGWDLLRQCSGFGGIDAEESATPAAMAIREVSDWCSHSFARIEAALAHLHPEVEQYVFQGLVPVTGPAAVVAVELLLERLDALAGTGPLAAERKHDTKADKAALATLASRGFDHTELKRVHALVVAAQGVAPPTEEDPNTPALTQSEALTGLKAWFDDWSATAHAVLTKRGDLIKLGLAKRLTTKSAAAAPTPPAPTPAIPVATGAASAPAPAAPVTTPVTPPGATVMSIATPGKRGEVSAN
jgi:hypothetical protein